MTDLPLRMRLSDEDFLTFDGPTGEVVAPDDSRANFYHHLGLREDVYRHKTIYRAMKNEAKAGMERLFATRKSLRPDIVEDDSIETPYTVQQISEFAFQQEVHRIYKTAKRQSRCWYDMMDTGDGNNWVIRWMLWRALRQAELRAVSSADSSGAETEDSCALTTASTAVDYPSAQTEPTSPLDPLFTSPTWKETHSPRRYSDIEDDDLDDRPRKAIKLESDASSSRQTGFWNHVMNT